MLGNGQRGGQASVKKTKLHYGSNMNARNEVKFPDGGYCQELYRVFSQLGEGISVFPDRQELERGFFFGAVRPRGVSS